MLLEAERDGRSVTSETSNEATLKPTVKPMPVTAKIWGGKWAPFAVCALLAAGCNETGVKPLAVKQPAPTPVPAIKVLGVLPVPDAPPDLTALRQTDTRPARHRPGARSGSLR